MIQPTNKRNEFIDRYKTFTVGQLIQIVDNPTGYQKLAVEAANIELIRRNIPQDEIDVSRADLLAKLNKKSDLEILKNHIFKYIKNSISRYIEGENKIVKKEILNYVFFLVIILIYQIITKLQTIIYLLNDSEYWDIYSSTYGLPLLYLPLCVFLLLKELRLGWTLTTAWFVYIITGLVFNIFFYFQFDSSGSSILDDLIPRQDIGTNILGIALFGFSLHYFSSSQLRHFFKISKKSQRTTIFITITLMFLQYLASIM